MIHINILWNRGKENEWRSALANYWNYVKPTHLAVEKEFDSLSSDSIKRMNAEGWYNFLLHKYFFWKYTAPRRYAFTTGHLKKYKATPCGLDELFRIKQRIFTFNKEDTVSGLKIACSIKGLGPAGASGLLAVLFPRHFATVDQFAVKALLGIKSFSGRTSILSMNPDRLRLKDAVVLIDIMKYKARELNDRFRTTFWTPRKIDMILWSVCR